MFKNRFCFIGCDIVVKNISNYEKKLMIECINKSDIGGSYGYFDAKWLRENGALKSQYFKTPIIDAYPEFDIKKIEGY